MIAKSLLGFVAIVYLATSGVATENKKDSKKGGPSKVGKASVDVDKDAIDHVTVSPNDDGSVVIFTAHEGHLIEKVFQGSTFVTKFNLDTHTPKSVAKHVKDGKIYVTAAIENALHLAYKKEGDKYEEMPIVDFYENILFKGREGVSVDLDKHDDASIFTITTFGSGKKYTFSSQNKRVGSVVSGEDDVILKGDDEFVTELHIFVGSGRQISRIVYLYKPDGRFKEVFFERTEDDGWDRVEVTTAAEALHNIDSTFPADYRTIYDGFHVYGVFFSVITAIFAVVLLSFQL